MQYIKLHELKFKFKNSFTSKTDVVSIIKKIVITKDANCEI